MKPLQKFLLVAFTLGFATVAMGQDLQKLLTEGQTAMLRGDLVTAKRSFQMAEKIAPRNPTVIGYLKQIAAAEAKAPTSPAVERQLSELIIPQIQFKEATFAAALEFMKKKATELSNGKVSVNFVLQMPPEQQNKPVSLTLSNIPFTEALRYVSDLVEAKVEYQKFAIVIRGNGGGGAAPATEAPATTTDKLPGQ